MKTARDLTAKDIWTLLKDTFNDFTSDSAMQHAAALAFYTIFSLGPILIIVLAIAGMVWGQEAARGELVGQFRGIAGEGGAQQIESILENAHKSGAGPMATIIGFVTLIMGATGIFAQLKASLNTIWEVQVKPGRGLWGIVRDRLLSFGVVLAIAFLLLATLVASAAISALSKWMDNVLPAPPAVFYLLDLVVSIGVLTLLFAAIFKWLPDVQIKWRDVWIGAAVTALLFTIGKFALGLYLGRSSAASVYGAAGSLIVILLWVYYSSVIFLFGAEFTQVYAHWRGADIEPSPIAQWADSCERHQKAMAQKSARSSAPPPFAHPATIPPRQPSRLPPSPYRHPPPAPVPAYARAAERPRGFGSIVTGLAAAVIVDYWASRRQEQREGEGRGGDRMKRA